MTSQTFLLLRLSVANPILNVVCINTTLTMISLDQAMLTHLKVHHQPFSDALKQTFSLPRDSLTGLRQAH